MNLKRFFSQVIPVRIIVTDGHMPDEQNMTIFKCPENLKLKIK